MSTSPDDNPNDETLSQDLDFSETLEAPLIFEPTLKTLEVELPDMGGVHWMIVFTTMALKKLRETREVMEVAGSSQAVNTLNEAEHCFNSVLTCLADVQEANSRERREWEMARQNDQPGAYQFDVTHPASELDTSDEPPKE